MPQAIGHAGCARGVAPNGWPWLIGLGWSPQPRAAIGGMTEAGMVHTTIVRMTRCLPVVGAHHGRLAVDCSDGLQSYRWPMVRDLTVVARGLPHGAWLGRVTEPWLCLDIQCAARRLIDGYLLCHGVGS